MDLEAYNAVDMVDFDIYPSTDKKPTGTRDREHGLTSAAIGAESRKEAAYSIAR